MKRKRALLLALIMAFLLIAGCDGGSKPEPSGSEPAGSEDPVDTTEPPDVDTSPTNINLCIASEPETLDPNMVSSVDGATYTQHTFEGLMKYVATGETVGADGEMKDTAIDFGQAASYEATKNDAGQPVYTFKLRDNIFWSDGEPVKAGDFEYSWKRIVDPALAADYGYILDGIVLNAAKIQAEEADPSELGIVAKDDKTLEITLEAECPYFVELCAFSALMPLRKDVIDKHGAAWTDPGNMVGNGAFVLTEWVHDSYIKMAPNEKYYDAANVSDITLTWWLSDSATAMLSAYESGVYDFFDSPPLDRIEDLQASGDAFIAPYVGTYYTYLNTERIKDWRVRAALALSVDRDYLVESVTQGGQTAATGFVPSGIVDSEGDDWAEKRPNVMFNQLQAKYPEYDLSDYEGRTELAQFLYNQAVEEGAWDPNTTLVYNFNTSEAHKVIAEALQSDWDSVLGVKITLANQDWNVYTAGLGEGEFDVARLGWIADYNDPITFLELLATGNSYNYGRWASDDYTKLINSAKELPGGKDRDKFLTDAEKLHFDEGGFTVSPLYYYTNIYCRSGALKNVEYTSFGYFFFHRAEKVA
jgi:oligopeptide transport system substrate-binding protein